MAAVLARLQQRGRPGREAPPPYEAPPSYTAALALAPLHPGTKQPAPGPQPALPPASPPPAYSHLSLHPRPPPYVLREAVIV
jgi:hypothetical protein